MGFLLKIKDIPSFINIDCDSNIENYFDELLNLELFNSVDHSIYKFKKYNEIASISSYNCNFKRFVYFQ